VAASPSSSKTFAAEDFDMARILEFASHHLWLVSAFMAVLVALLYTVIKSAVGNALSPAEGVLLLNREDAVPVDLRPEASFRAGHIINAVNLDPAKLDEAPKKLEKFKARPLLVYCDSGNSSSKAVTRLRAAGFPKVFELRGGLAAWRADSLPVETGR